MIDLKTEIVGSCDKCNESGFLPDEFGTVCKPCECLLKFRAYNRMVSGGYYKNMLDFCNSDEYILPYLDSGEDYLNYFLNNIDLVEQEGLGLFIYSKDRGRGKTTLAHYIMYQVVRNFFDKSKYKSSREYVFESANMLLKDFMSKNPADLWRKSWYVLDDLGNEDRSSDWKREAMLTGLQSLLQYRRPKGLPLIITSNYSPGDLSMLYGGVLDSLLEIRVDGKIGGEFYKEISVGGSEDLRMVSENSKWGF